MPESLLNMEAEPTTAPPPTAPEGQAAPDENAPVSGELLQGAQAGETNADQPAANDSTAEQSKDSTPEGQGNDWAAIRTRIAAGDEKILNRLSRYSTLDDFIKAGIEAQNKIGGAKAAKVPGPDATPEELAAYRKENGIPDSPKDYKIELPDDIVLGEADKPIADAFLEVAHKHNLPPAVANDIIAHQLKLQEEFVQEQEQADAKDRAVAEDTLGSNDMWGSESRANVNLIKNMLASAPEGVAENLMNARLADGKLLGNDINTLRWLCNTARTLEPYATVTPAAGKTAGETVAGRIAEIEAEMAKGYDGPYHKGPQAASMQAEYRNLLELRNKAERVGR